MSENNNSRTQNLQTDNKLTPHNKNQFTKKEV